MAAMEQARDDSDTGRQVRGQKGDRGGHGPSVEVVVGKASDVQGGGETGNRGAGWEELKRIWMGWAQRSWYCRAVSLALRSAVLFSSAIMVTYIARDEPLLNNRPGGRGRRGGGFAELFLSFGEFVRRGAAGFGF